MTVLSKSGGEGEVAANALAVSEMCWKVYMRFVSKDSVVQYWKCIAERKGKSTTIVS